MLDAALGKGAWHVEELGVTVEFEEEEEEQGACTCCVSLIVRLTCDASGAVHDETGTGTVTVRRGGGGAQAEVGAKASEDARGAAIRRARERGMQRLAKRFVGFLSQSTLKAIGAQLQAESGAQKRKAS